MSFTRNLTCMCFMAVLLQYTCRAACMPLGQTRTKNQAPTTRAPSSSQRECGTLLSTAELNALKVEIRGKLRAIHTNMNEVVRDIFGSGQISSSIGLYPNRTFSRLEIDHPRENQSVAESVHYFRCFIGPMADALKNETDRNIIEPSYYNQFYTTFGNLPATDIYKLVKGDPNMFGCIVPGFSDRCPPLQLIEAPGDYTHRQQVIGAIANELNFLAFDLLQFENLN